jgi:undecaprenyl-diphosphatase
MNSFDLSGYHMINQWAGHVPILDMFMSFTAQYALELYALLFVIAWFTLPKSEETRRHALIVAGFSGILALILNVLISHVWFRPRPFVALPKGSFTQLIPHTIDASFPSDHVSGSFGFAAGSWKRADRWVSYSFTSLAILVAISRVYVGVHWPTDVIGGLIVGLLSARIMWAVNFLLKPISRFGMRLFHFGPYAVIPSSKHEL